MKHFDNNEENDSSNYNETVLCKYNNDVRIKNIV